MRVVQRVVAVIVVGRQYWWKKSVGRARRGRKVLCCFSQGGTPCDHYYGEPSGHS